MHQQQATSSAKHTQFEWRTEQKLTKITLRSCFLFHLVPFLAFSLTHSRKAPWNVYQFCVCCLFVSFTSAVSIIIRSTLLLRIFSPCRFCLFVSTSLSHRSHRLLVCVKKNRRVIGNDLINEIGFVIYIVFFCVRFLSLIAEMSETGGRLYETHCVTLVIATHCSLLSVFWALRKRPCNVISWRGKKFFDHKSFPSCNSMPSCSLHRTSGSIR